MKLCDLKKLVDYWIQEVGKNEEVVFEPGSGGLVSPRANHSFYDPDSKRVVVNCFPVKGH